MPPNASSFIYGLPLVGHPKTPWHQPFTDVPLVSGYQSIRNTPTLGTRTVVILNQDRILLRIPSKRPGVRRAAMSPYRVHY